MASVVKGGKSGCHAPLPMQIGPDTLRCWGRSYPHWPVVVEVVGDDVVVDVVVVGGVVEDVGPLQGHKGGPWAFGRPTTQCTLKVPSERKDGSSKHASARPA